MAEDSAGLPANPAGTRANPNPAQHVGPEVSEILLARRHRMITQGRAPSPEPTRAPPTSPETMSHRLRRDTLPETEGRSERLVAARRLRRPWSGPDRLRALFEETLRGAGTWDWTWPEDLLGELRVTVAMIGMPPSTYTEMTVDTQPFSLYESRMDELDEAWVPVVCADGPALLI